jgi:hypothetical protein
MASYARVATAEPAEQPASAPSLLAGWRSFFSPAARPSPADAARAFSASLRSQFGALAPPLSESSFDEAMRSAPPAGRPILVYLHSELHADAAEFLRAGLCTPEVSAAIAAVGYVVWGGAVHEPSAWEAALRLEAAAFPFLGVYTPSEGNTFSRVWVLEGGPLLSGAELAAVLRHVGSGARAASTRVASARTAAESERQLRQQQQR